MRASCRDFDADLQEANGFQERLYYRVAEAQLLYLIYCDEKFVAIDAVSRAVAFRHSAALYADFAPYPGGIAITSIRDGVYGSVPASGAVGQAWFPDRTGGLTAPQRQVFGATLVDWRQVDSSASGPSRCEFALSYRDRNNDRHSLRPFPSTFVPKNPNLGADDHPVTLESTCTSPNVFQALSGPVFEAQVAHQRISTAARHALWQPAIRLLAWRGSNDSSAVKVQVHGTPVRECGRSSGSYFWPEHKICLWSGSGSFNRWTTPLHEYGHYTNHLLGWTHGAGLNSCDVHAAHEGAADAHVLNFEHFRYDPLGRLSDDTVPNAAGVMQTREEKISDLYRSGPGPGLRRFFANNPTPARPRGLAFTGTSSPPSAGFVHAFRTSCPGLVSIPSVQESYYKGMAISQVMWKLLNNRVCVSFPCGSNAEVRQISERLSDRRVADIGRIAFVSAISAGPGNVGQFLTTMKFLIVATTPDYFTDPDFRRRLNMVFAQNGIVRL